MSNSMSGEDFQQFLIDNGLLDAATTAQSVMSKALESGWIPEKPSTTAEAVTSGFLAPFKKSRSQ